MDATGYGLTSSRGKALTGVLGLVGLLALSGSACNTRAVKNSPPSVAFGDCVAPEHPPAGGTVRLERVFPDVSFDESIQLLHRPNDDARWYLVTQPGVIYTFEDSGAATEFADLRSVIATAAEAGLLGMAFHPAYAKNRQVFLSYTTPGPGAFTSRVSRFTSTDDGLRLDRDSEEVIFEVRQPAENHNGGEIAFGPDGLLYIALGDGGGGGDTFGNGQNPDTVLGAILRIDVDTMSPYAIPPDNPFADGGGAPEIFAWGLRNPWRMTFDRATGELWTGDVGQNAWEEVDLVELGRNYGWNALEGAHCFERAECAEPEFVEPVAEYRNTDRASVVAGAVYRGQALPSLTGRFLYSDFYMGTLWAVRPGESPEVLLESGAREVASYAQDLAGEMYAVAYGGGVFKLVEADPAASELPRKLSQTGCIRMDRPEQPASGLLSYTVASPLWSDGAEKQRFLSLPKDSRITIENDGDWDLPTGSVVVKSFKLGDQLVETRLFMRHGDGQWAGYSYEWNDAGTEATLLEGSQQRRFGDQTWDYPGRGDCLSCHTQAAGGTLGLENAQLAAVNADLFEQLVQRGHLPRAPEGEPFAALDSDAPVAERARAYLHSNCSHCHRPGAPAGRAAIDLRFDTPLATTGLMDAPPRTDDLGVAEARLVAPGAPERSLVLLRMRDLGEARMPDLATRIVDEAAADVVEQWIESEAE